MALRTCGGSLLGAALLAGLLIGASADAAEVYRPRHRTAEELAPVAEAILGPAGRVAVDPHGGALVLAGDEAAITEALATIRALDVRPAVWRVETTLIRSADLARAGIRVGGWIDAGFARIGRAGSPPGGPRIAVGASEGQRERSFRGEVTVLDGHTAEVWTGSIHAARDLDPDARPGRARVRETTELVPVPTGFRVLPRGRPDGSVELEIGTAVSERAAGGIAFAATSTRVTVRPGEMLVLAAAGERSEDATGDLLGAAGRSEEQETATLLRVERVDAGPAGDPVSPASSGRSP
jgi:hypothetical protein